MDNLLILDNALTPEECRSLIESQENNLKTDLKNTYLNYEYADMFDHESHPILGPLTKRIVTAYVDRFPAIKYTVDRWFVDGWRIKVFKEGRSFEAWHQEHTADFPLRIACVLVYLTDNNCGTEFMATGDVIGSKQGRAIMFPTSWTHTHRGQRDPDNKDRWIMSVYAHLNPISQVDISCDTRSAKIFIEQSERKNAV